MRVFKLSVLPILSAFSLSQAMAVEEGDGDAAPAEAADDVVVDAVGVAEGSTLTVKFLGAPSQEGVVLIALFDNEEDFLTNAVQYQAVAIDTEGNGEAVFSALPDTNYAVSVIHDKDENGKLSLGFLGIPKEKYGFSNGAKGRFGPPDYEDVVIDIEETASIQIRLSGD